MVVIMTDLSPEYVSDIFVEHSELYAQSVKELFGKSLSNKNTGTRLAQIYHKAKTRSRQATVWSAITSVGVWVPEQHSVVPTGTLSEFYSEIEFSDNLSRWVKLQLRNIAPGPGVMALELHEADRTRDITPGHTLVPDGAKELNRYASVETEERLQQYLERSLACLVWLASDEFPQGNPY